MRWLFLVFLFCSPAQAQISFPLERLGKFWQSEESRPPADFSDLRFRSDEGGLRVEGVDDAGTPWKIWLPSPAWVEAPVAYRADLDANGRQDLLFVSNHNGNGTCVEGGTITALMMNSTGNPVPWQTSSEGQDSEYRPEVLVDLDHDGKAELLTSGCRRVDSDEASARRRWLNGIYGADAAS